MATVSLNGQRFLESLRPAASEPGRSCNELELGAYERGYTKLLEQLTTVGNASDDMLQDRFNQMKSINGLDKHYAIVVIEDVDANKIVACSTLFLEYKIIHECSMRGRLEDVAMLDSYRSRKLGELVVRLIVELARETYKCYKITLDRMEELKEFYAKNQFTYRSNMVAIRLKQ